MILLYKLLFMWIAVPCIQTQSLRIPLLSTHHLLISKLQRLQGRTVCCRHMSTRTIMSAGTMVSADTTKRKVICIAGPTASGKSSVAMKVCEALGGEIVSADSVQVYRRLQIGANKPSEEDQSRVRHHMIDYADLGGAGVTVGQWLPRALHAIDDIIERGKVPVVVGGTMLYTQWLVQGKPDAPAGDEATLAEVQALIGPYEAVGDWEGGLQILQEKNPARAENLSRNDWMRLGRSLQILMSVERSQGDSGTVFTGEREGPARDTYDMRNFFIVADRMEAARKIDARCLQMLEAGLLREVAELYCEGILQRSSMAGKAIGYRQALDYLLRDDPKYNDKEAFLRFFESFSSNTRQYAAHQLKWFRTDKGEDFMWIYRDVNDAESIQAVTERVIETFSLAPSEYKDILEGEEQVQLRKNNAAQAKKMRTFVPLNLTLAGAGSEHSFDQLLEEADACTRLIQQAI